MTESKTDPRFLRTRKLIMDSFIELSSKKEFKDITIKDITTAATINRATFYYHFEDKYDLLEKALSEVFLINLKSEGVEDELNEETIVRMFLAVTNFQASLSNRCHRGYESTIAAIIKEQLEVMFSRMLYKQHKTDQNEALRITAVILSSGLYGASQDWLRNSSGMAPEDYIKLAIPYILK
ncbi:TetR/AcrR family transcriptional regulator [Niallia oryzisoli]|uniref:TetR/AcrR family transcriptional regulator n=1 Tax=Niallia oryzisoli TaxID=1737571 RepID=UPI0037369373